LASKAIEFGLKNAKYVVQSNSRSFNDIEVGINRKPVRDFLLVINTN